MKNPFTLFAVLCTIITALIAFTNVSAADLDSPKSAYANVPGGQVWLNPGEAYEHDTGLVRDVYGQRSHRPLHGVASRPSSSGCHNCRRPRPNYVQPNYIRPSYAPPIYRPAPYYPSAQPNYPPNVSPFYRPNYRQPSYRQPDFGPYVPTHQRRTSHAWGVDPMEIPKTGDAPLAQ